MEDERERLSEAMKRVLMQSDIARMKEDIDDINETLYNDGKGIVYDVKHLKRHNDSGHGRATAFINIISVLISFIVMILMIIEKMK